MTSSNQGFGFFRLWFCSSRLRVRDVGLRHRQPLIDFQRSTATLGTTVARVLVRNSKLSCLYGVLRRGELDRNGRPAQQAAIRPKLNQNPQRHERSHAFCTLWEKIDQKSITLSVEVSFDHPWEAEARKFTKQSLN